MNKFIPFLIIMLCRIQGSACDFCNCYMGLNPKYKSNIVGLNYSSSFSEGSHTMGTDISHSEINMKMVEEEYNLYGQILPLDKFQISFTIPYVINRQHISEKKSETYVNSHHGEEHTFIYNHTESSDQIYSGIGDPLVIFHYQLLNNNADDSGKYNFKLLAGAGIKLPLGDWKLNPNDFHQSRSHLPGSGSWDYISSVRYFSQYKKFGLNVNSNFLLTTENAELYKFGNRLNINGSLLYNINSNYSSYFPHVGLFYESAEIDKFESKKVVNSGGDILLFDAGLDYYYKNFSITTDFQIPVSQKLNGIQPETKSKFLVGLVYIID